MKIKIYYFTFRDLRKLRPTNIVVMNTCHQLANLGFDLTLFMPQGKEKNDITSESIWDLYDIPPKSFTIVGIDGRFNNILFSKLWQFFWHCINNVKILLSKEWEQYERMIFISRDMFSFLPYIFFSNCYRVQRVLVYELHDPSKTLYHRFTYKLLNRIYCTTDQLNRWLVEEIGLEKDKVQTIRNGYNPDYYKNMPAKNDIRKKLEIPIGRPVAVYTGKIGIDQTEIKYLLLAAQKQTDVLFIFVGGRQKSLNFWKNYAFEKGIVNVRFQGLLNPKDVALFQTAADYLLLYYPGNWPIKNSLSPVKMMEYMATGNVIISVDFSTIAEVLIHNSNAILLESDNPTALSEAIDYLNRNDDLRKRLGLKAKQSAKSYTWENRARTIADFVCPIPYNQVMSEGKSPL